MTYIVLGRDDKGTEASLPLARANRHGLIAGATGAGKTVSMMRLVEGLSRAGVPTFVPDVKGDVAGVCSGARPLPTVFWDPEGKRGHPFRVPVRRFGAGLFARTIGVTGVQADVLGVAFRYAADENLPFDTLKDVQEVLRSVDEERKSVSIDHGLVSSATVAAIRRSIATFEADGGGLIFGPKSIARDDLFLQTDDEQGFVTVLVADNLVKNARVYATVMTWILSDLYENLPEVGDLAIPKLAMFIDEAYLLFEDAPRPLVDRIGRIVRIIRSKSVGVWFCTQSPSDLPSVVLGQLGSRVQHAMRAATPKDWRAIKAAADTMPRGKSLDPATEISVLRIGHALVSFLDEQGSPTPTIKVRVDPPEFRVGAVDDRSRQGVVRNSPLASRFRPRSDPRPPGFGRTRPAETRGADEAAARFGRNAGRAVASVLRFVKKSLQRRGGGVNFRSSAKGAT